MTGANDLVYIQNYKTVIMAEIRKDRLLDMPTITAVGDALLAIPAQHMKVSLALDLGKVTAMSSQMLGKLIALHKSVSEVKGRLAIGGVTPQLLPLFKTTKLDKLLGLTADLQETVLVWQRKPL
jgi:anti-anti-sigma factor